MPCYMAVEGPYTRVVGFHLENCVAKGRNGESVTTFGVGVVGNTAVPGAKARGEDVEIVACGCLV